MTHPAASFRDPTGSCCIIDGHFLRLLTAEGASALQGFLQTPVARAFSARRELVATRSLGEPELNGLRGSPKLPAAFRNGHLAAVVEHDRIPFPSYPYEWPAEMLWEAGRLTLELARASLGDGYGLKDATPYNVLFRGCQPVFVDLLSFEARAPGDPVWLAYAQFVRTFLLPLLANQCWGLRLADIFTSRRDGLEPEELHAMRKGLQRLNPRILSLVSMPTWLKSKAHSTGGELYKSQILKNSEKARFILDSQLRRLQAALNGLQSRPRQDSTWSDYMATHSYSQDAFDAKEKFVHQLLAEFKPARVLDVGANTGHFGVLAARSGAEVLAIDLDPVCVGAIWRQVRKENLNILPLVIDLARPSPALGWRNAECASFLDRATGAFEGVLMLAVLHHLLVSERIPLQEIIRLASELTTSLLVVEFVGPQDEMLRQLARGRDQLHAGLNEAAFEAACAPLFETVRSLALPGTHRRIYALKKRGAGA